MVLTALYMPAFDNCCFSSQRAAMKPITLIAPVLLAASLTIVSLATAQPTPPQPSMKGEHDAGRDDDRGPGPEPLLQLTEAQQDKLFALHHAAEPAQRTRDKAIRRAQDSLRELAGSLRFDDAKAAALAQTLGQAFAAEELDRARGHAQFLSLLTPEQRAAMQEEKVQHGFGRRGEVGK
jgi:protein CpxP